MILFPAIDLVGGQVVRLAKGDRAHMDVYSNDPVAVAEAFRDAGATWIHVVDLSATLEEDETARAANSAAIQSICAVSGISVDAGGGVRSMEAIERLVSLGVKRIAIGTALVRDPAFAEAAARGGEVRVNGWREGAALSADELVKQLASLGFRHLVFTDVARDGMRCGIDTETYQHIAQVAGFPVVASGGIASLEDIRALAALGPEVIEGAICGRALYEGEFMLEDALKAAQSSYYR